MSRQSFSSLKMPLSAVSQPGKPVRSIAPNFIYASCSLPAKSLKTVSNCCIFFFSGQFLVHPMLIVLCCHLQVNQSLVTTIHSNLFSQHSFGRPSRLYATGCHAKLFFFLIQGAFSNMRCLCPNIIRNSSGTNSQSWRLEQNVLLVRSKRSGNYGGGPTMDRQNSRK